MRAQLYPKNEKQEYLSPREVASKLAETMPTVVVDWTRGNQEVDQALQQLIAMNTPEAILASHRSLLDQTVYIEVSFPMFPGKYVHFFVQPQSRISLEASVPEGIDFIRYAADTISSALGYVFEIVTS